MGKSKGWGRLNQKIGAWEYKGNQGGLEGG